MMTNQEHLDVKEVHFTLKDESKMEEGFKEMIAYRQGHPETLVFWNTRRGAKIEVKAEDQPHQLLARLDDYIKDAIALQRAITAGAAR